jgi:hypothetical protein
MGLRHAGHLYLARHGRPEAFSVDSQSVLPNDSGSEEIIAERERTIWIFKQTGLLRLG